MFVITHYNFGVTKQLLSDILILQVTSLKPLPDLNSGETGSKDRLSAFRVVSVDSGGQLVIWTVLDFQTDYEKNLGLAHWGQVE